MLRSGAQVCGSSIGVNVVGGSTSWEGQGREESIHSIPCFTQYHIK